MTTSETAGAASPTPETVDASQPASAPVGARIDVPVAPLGVKSGARLVT